MPRPGPGRGARPVRGRRVSGAARGPDQRARVPAAGQQARGDAGLAAAGRVSARAPGLSRQQPAVDVPVEFDREAQFREEEVRDTNGAREVDVVYDQRREESVAAGAL